MRFGTSAGAVFAAVTVDVTRGAINAESDSLNPLAGLSPFTGMWLNAIFGGKGVRMINMLLFLIIGVDLRHAHATYLVAAGVDHRTVADLWVTPARPSRWRRTHARRRRPSTERRRLLMNW